MVGSYQRLRQAQLVSGIVVGVIERVAEILTGGPVLFGCLGRLAAAKPHSAELLLLGVVKAGSEDRSRSESERDGYYRRQEQRARMKARREACRNRGKGFRPAAGAACKPCIKLL